MTKPHPMRNASPKSPDVECSHWGSCLSRTSMASIKIHRARSSGGCKCSPWGQFCAHGKQFLGASQFTSCVSCTSTMYRRIIDSTFWWGGPVAVWHIIRGFLANWCPEKRVPSIKYDSATTSNPTSTSKWWHSGTSLNRWIRWRLDTCCHQLLRVEWSCK